MGTYFDLSNVFFICTSNNIESISPPLLDRLEIIDISAYTQKEKIEIAKRYLIPKQIKANGLESQMAQHDIKIQFSDEILEILVDEYTYESGVRNLERKISAVCRHLASEVNEHVELNGDQPLKKNYVISKELLQEIFGRSITRFNIRDRTGIPGIAIGMAYTLNGGTAILIETCLYNGKGKVNITGNIKEIMKESVLTALSWIQANSKFLNIKANLDQMDLHVHVPSAATPKDGPSAGITIAIALISLLRGVEVRNDTAMTGELSLTGFVLPVGGIKEKCLGAYSYGIKRFILPKRNEQDVKEIPLETSKQMRYC